MFLSEWKHAFPACGMLTVYSLIQFCLYIQHSARLVRMEWTFWSGRHSNIYDNML